MPRVNTDGTAFTNLHNFTGFINSTNFDGANPPAGLVLSGSTLYGTTEYGGSMNYGTVFALNVNGTGYTNLHSFNGYDGIRPLAGLMLAGNTLYGTSSGNGEGGNVFAVNTDGTGFTELLAFDGSGGLQPEAGVVLAGNTLYGTAYEGGFGNVGTVFSLSVLASAAFNARPAIGVAPLPVNFTASGFDNLGNAINSWFWTFGDGSTSTAQNPAHTYATTGNFSPTLVATYTLGGTVPGVGPDSITVVAPPGFANFSLAGTNLMFSGTNGLAGSTYYLLTTTNIAVAFGLWTRVATNVLDASGDFTITATNAVTGGNHPRYYILKAR